MDIAHISAGSLSPSLVIPTRFNAAHDLVARNLNAGRANKIAYIDDAGEYKYGELAARIDAVATEFRRIGLRRESRCLICLKDGIDFPVAFLGSIKAGIVPVPVNTMLAADDYAYLLNDSEASALVVSDELFPLFQPLLVRSPSVEHVFVSGERVPPGSRAFRKLEGTVRNFCEPAPTRRDDPCFWLYSSGSTGTPKGAVHIHSSLLETAVYYAQTTLGLHERDRVFSAAKLFFAYGLGNSLTFPLSVGATAILMAERSAPGAVAARLRAERPTVFSGVPTVFASLLGSGTLPAKSELSLRLCNSAGEALPEELARRWRERTGVEIIDGIGSTEMLHIFISNRPGQVRHGTLGTPVPGFDAKIVDDVGAAVNTGETGDLWVRGPTSAKLYWNQPERSRATFLGPWTRTGDRFRVDTDGNYVYAGRADDMLKVGGIYVSPIEVESALAAHPAVHEAAVVGREDADRLVKPVAYIVLVSGAAPSEALALELKTFVKSRLAPYKYPRWIEFVGDLPKTTTGKIQRFKLRNSCPPSS